MSLLGFTLPLEVTDLTSIFLAVSIRVSKPRSRIQSLSWSSSHGGETHCLRVCYYSLMMGRVCYRTVMQ